MKLVPNAIARRVAMQGLRMQKHAPTLLFGGGVVGVVGSTVLACRATLKLEDVLEVAKQDLFVAETLKSDQYSEEDRRNDMRIIRVRAAGSVIKLYSPAILLGGVSIAALTRSHNMLNRRNAGLAAAYAALEKGFDEYRARVVAKYGDEQDQQFRYATEHITIENAETGKSETIVRVSPDAASVYAQFFDEYCSSWSKVPEYNVYFLKAQQSYWNNILQSRGYVFLNEVYEGLGMRTTSAGAVVGWVIGKDGGNDNYISFGIWDGRTDEVRDFVNGRNASVLCDFNVDGVIYDKIDDINQGAIAWQQDK